MKFLFMSCLSLAICLFFASSLVTAQIKPIGPIGPIKPIRSVPRNSGGAKHHAPRQKKIGGASLYKSGRVSPIKVRTPNRRPRLRMF